MGTIEENRRHWTSYDWSRRGDEWSEAWGGSEALWWGTLWPRLRRFLPADDVLEIAPGFGRVTAFVAPLARRMTVVDLTERCVEHCRERFRDLGHLSYHVNDGRSLPFLADASIDFAFSFDSLVHAELDALEGYVRELGRVLRPGGAAFLHHSNIADARARAGHEIDNHHWRGASVGAEAVAAAARGAGLDCPVQERIGWGGDLLNDCFSLLVRRAPTGTTARREHTSFMREAELARELAELYRPFDERPPRRATRPGGRSWLRWLGR